MKYVKTFEKYIFDVDAIGEISGRNVSKKELLNYIESGGDIEIPDRNGDTPLIRSARNYKYSILEILIAAGADINHQNNKGENALICATRHLTSSDNSINIIYKLIDSDADWNLIRYKDSDIDNRRMNKSTSRFYRDNDFFEMLSPKYQEIIKEKYPEKYQDYLLKKKTRKYNI